MLENFQQHHAAGEKYEKPKDIEKFNHSIILNCLPTTQKLVLILKCLLKVSNEKSDHGNFKLDYNKVSDERNPDFPI